MTPAENIRTYLDAAGEAEIAAGKAWYREAHRIALALAKRHDISLAQSAGVIAALSPQCAWSENIAAAESAMITFAAGGSPVDALRGHPCYPENMDKAWRILADPAFGRPASICDGKRIGKRGRVIGCAHKAGQCEATLRGPKVSAFYRAILGAPDGAVDVWATRAADIALSELADLPDSDPRRDGVPGSRHGDITRAYAAAGADYGLAGHEAQAVVWVTIRAHYVRRARRSNGIVRKDDIPF